MKYITRIGNLYDVPATSEYNVSYENVWADGSGRETLDGTFIGTFIGVFPRISVTFPPLADTIEKELIHTCRKPSIEITWWDLTKKQYRTDNFYPDQIQVGVLLSDKNIGKPLSLTFNAEKRDIIW